MPLCPHANSSLFHGLLTDQFWLDGTMELARRSDAAMLVPGWPRSSGSIAEREDFLARGLRVFSPEDYDALKRWLLETER